MVPPIVIAEEESPPRFKHVAEFLAWADKKLAVDDYDGLSAAQKNTTDTRQTRIAYVKKLDADLGETKLATVFEGREFPIDAATFKLGGHQEELGHCHIDFTKNGDSWQITRIWHCR